MKKPLIVSLVIVGVLALGAGVYYVYISEDGPEEAALVQESKPRSEQPESETKKMAEADSEPSASGAYVDYSEAKVSSTKGTKILFFHAPWCPQCRALDADINSSKLPENVTIFKTDYDSNQALRQKYGVTLQTTLVAIDDNGDLVKKYVAYNEPNYQTVNQEFISKL